MKTSLSIAALLFACLLPLGCAMAQADAPREATSVPGMATPLAAGTKTVLMADDTPVGKTLPAFAPYPKRIWLSGWQKAAQALAWEVSAPADGDYAVEVISSGVPALRLTSGMGVPLDAQIKNLGWSRNALGVVRLKKGTSTLTLSLPADLPHPGAVRSMDLLPVADQVDYLKRVAASRADTGWMREGKYGVMLQYGGWGYPQHGPKQPWEEVVKHFDVEKFAKMVDEDMGAKWVIWSITWRNSHFPMPLKSVDAIVPGHTTTRDLPADLAAALKKRGIKLMFYFHAGFEDKTWWAANWKNPHDKTLYIKNWTAVIGEIGARYRENLAGWFFDDGGTVLAPAPFETMTRAAKTGFPGRLVTYNNWVLPAMTDFQDIQMGEQFTGSSETEIGSNGIYQAGQHPGMQAHGMFTVNSGDWGVWQPNTRIPLTVGADRAIGIVKNANRRGQVMSLNFDMYEDGTVSGPTLDMFRQLKKAICGPRPVTENQPATASGQWAAPFSAGMAVDGEPGTFWSLGQGQKTGWLAVDLKQPTAVSRAVIQEGRLHLVTQFAIEAQQADGTWLKIAQGTDIGAEKELTFAPAKAQLFRLSILDSKADADGSAPMIAEFQLFEK